MTMMMLMATSSLYGTVSCHQGRFVNRSSSMAITVSADIVMLAAASSGARSLGSGGLLGSFALWVAVPGASKIDWQGKIPLMRLYEHAP